MLRDAVDLMLAGSQHDFPVTDECGSLLGMVTRSRLVQALAEHGPGYPVELILEPCPDPPGLFGSNQKSGQIQGRAFCAGHFTPVLP